MTQAKPRLFGTLQDQARLLEGRHDVEASKASHKVAGTKAGQACLTESVEELASGRETLRLAMLAHAREVGETDQARQALNAAVSDAVATYGYVRRKVDDALLNLLPEEARALPPKEMEVRERAFQRVLGRNPSDITNQGPERQLTILGEVARAVEQDPLLGGVNAHQGLIAAIRRADDVQLGLARERTEDSDAMQALVAAREAFDRSSKAHAQLVRSLLTRQGREAELGHFLKAQDAAYAARRRTQQPMEDEPDADSASVHTPTDPTSSPADPAR